MDASNLPVGTAIAPVPKRPPAASPVQLERDNAFAALAGDGIEQDELTEEPVGPLLDKPDVNLASPAQMQAYANQQRLLQIRQERLDSVQDIESTILSDSTLSPEAMAESINKVRTSALKGVNSEDIAVESILAGEMEAAETASEEMAALATGLEIMDRRSVKDELQALKEALDADFEPTIPFVENGIEMLTSGILFPLSSGTNISYTLEDLLGVKSGFLSQFAPSKQIEEARKIANTYTDQERVALLKRAHGMILERSGLVLNNHADAQKMYHALEGVFGTRVQMESATDDATWGVAIDAALTATGLKAGKIALNAAAKGTNKIAGKEVIKKPFKNKAEKAAADAERIEIPTEKVLPENQGIQAGTPAAVMAKVAPKTSGPVLADVLQDASEVTAKKFGTTRQEILSDYTIPNMSSDLMKRGPAIVFTHRAGAVQDEVQSLRKLMHDDELFSQQEVAGAIENLQSKVHTLVDEGAIHVPKIQMNPDVDTGEIAMDYVFGKAGGKEFATRAEAKKFLQERVDGYELEEPIFLRYDAKQDTFLPVADDASDKAGAWLVQARYNHKLGAADVKRKKKDKEDPFLTKGVNFLTNNVDSTVSYVRRIANAITKIDLRRGEAEKVLSDILKPLTSLSNTGSRNKVWNVLKKEELDAPARGRDLDEAEIYKAFDGNVEEIAAYNAVRKMYKTVYAIRNLNYRNHLKKGGYMTLRGLDDVDNWVRPITKDKKIAEVKTVWYEPEGTIVSLMDLERRGIQVDIFESFSPKKAFAPDRKTRQQTQYMAAPKGKAELQPLPDTVLNDVPGYLGRAQTAQYSIERVRKVIVNGKKEKIGELLKVADNIKSAEERVAELQAAGKGTFQWRRNDSPGAETFIAEEMKQLHDYGMLTNTKLRRDLNKLDITEKMAMKPPEDILNDVKQTIAKTVSMNEFIDYSSAKWADTYGHLVKGGLMPWGRDIPWRKDLKLTPEVINAQKKAIKFQQKIKLVAGIDEDQIGKKLQTKLQGISEYLSRSSRNIEKKSGKGLIRVPLLDLGSAAAARLGSRDLVSDSKFLGHLSYIIANPARQLFMQAGSGLLYKGVEHGTKYFASGRASADQTLLSLVRMTENVNTTARNNVVKAYSGITGKSVKETEDYIQLYKDSGLMSSMSNHQYLESATKGPTGFRGHAGNLAEAAGFGQKSARTIKNTGRFLSAKASGYGFEAGEEFHRMAAFNAVYNKNLVNGTLAGKTAIDLGREASQLAGNMGAANKAAFQNGAWGVPAQFLSHSTRMISLMMPTNKWTSYVASPIISNKEKAKIAAWSSALFGTGGWGISNMMGELAEDAGIEIDEGVQNRLEEGVVGLVAEAALSGLGGSDLDLNISDSIAPLSGVFGDVDVVVNWDENTRASTPIGKYAAAGIAIMLRNPKGLVENLGPGIDLGGKIMDVTQRSIDIFDAPQFATGEKIELEMRNFATLIPGLNNILQARLMVETSAYLDRNGNEIAKATVADALGKALLGVNGGDVEAYYDFKAKYTARYNYQPAANGKELSQSGKDIAAFTYGAMNLLKDGKLTREEVYDRIRVAYAAVDTAYTEEQFHHVKKAADKEMTRLFGDHQTKVDALLGVIASDDEMRAELGIDRVISILEDFRPSPYRDFVIQQLKNSYQEE